MKDYGRLKNRVSGLQVELPRYEKLREIRWKQVLRSVRKTGWGFGESALFHVPRKEPVETTRGQRRSCLVRIVFVSDRGLVQRKMLLDVDFSDIHVLNSPSSDGRLCVLVISWWHCLENKVPIGVGGDDQVKFC